MQPLFLKLFIYFVSSSAPAESAGRRRLPTLPATSRGNSPSYNSGSRQDCGWLQVNIQAQDRTAGGYRSIYRHKTGLRLVTGQYIGSRQDCSWLQVNIQAQDRTAAGQRSIYRLKTGLRLVTGQYIGSRQDCG